MNTNIRNTILLQALMAGLGLISVSESRAQAFKTLYAFTNGIDGGRPYAGLILSGHALYGTASGGGASSNGAVFAINADGTGFTNLHSFSFSDGANPWGGLILSGGTLYGAAVGGGSSSNGTIFRLNPDGTSFTNLYSFSATSFTSFSNPPPVLTNSDGARPYAGLILSSNVLYGTTGYGGTAGGGAVFRINTDGTGFTNLHSLNNDTDGSLPNGVLVLSGSTLYGTTVMGGASNLGAVFAVNTDGTGFTNLHSFRGDSDGVNPFAGLLLSGNTLYGTAATVFAVNTDGTGFRTLYSFFAGGPREDPYGGLTLSGHTLYGTTSGAGVADSGLVFAVNTDGTGFATLHSFAPFSGTNYQNSDGIAPQDNVILSGNTLYGTTLLGGSPGHGTIFSVSLPGPQLTITVSGTNAILTWPASGAGFVLQSTTTLGPPVVWSPVAPSPVIVNEQYMVTVPISGSQQFFELTQ